MLRLIESIAHHGIAAAVVFAAAGMIRADAAAIAILAVHGANLEVITLAFPRSKFSRRLASTLAAEPTSLPMLNDLSPCRSTSVALINGTVT
jgi:hypothetical protein